MSSSMRSRYYLYADPDCSFFLKKEGEDTLHRFPDFLAAVSFIHSTKGNHAADLTVYDALGKVALHDMHIESDDYLLFA